MSKKREIKRFYHGREIGILANYLGQWNSIPADADWLDYDEPVPEEWDESTQGIGIYEAVNASQEPEKYALANAVARICLTNIQESLPQWAAVDAKGKVKLGRKVKEPSQLPSRILLPRHLFTINWANSAPGLSWPEAYYVTQLLGWDVHVVTVSQDTDEIYGYEDFAIGWFHSKKDPVENSKDILVNYWQGLLCENDQERWEELLDVHFGDPEEWAVEVWPSEDEEDEPPRKTPTDVNRNAGSALTLETEDDLSLRKERGGYC